MNACPHCIIRCRHWKEIEASYKVARQERDVAHKDMVIVVEKAREVVSRLPRGGVLSPYDRGRADAIYAVFGMEPIALTLKPPPKPFIGKTA